MKSIMKKIFKFMLLPALVLPLLFTSCDEDRDSNPSLDLSHLAEGFVLNIPALAENNTYDLNSAKNLVLTCSQPNYGGVPYPVKYYAQVSIDPAFVSDPTVTHKELATYAENPSSLDFNAYEANKAVVSLFRAANPEANIPEKMSVYIRLRAVIGGTLNQTLGETYSNVITLPSVKATIPDAKFTENLFLTGSSIQKPWESWKSIPQVEGKEGNYYGIIYVPAGGEFNWGTEINDKLGINQIKEIVDEAGAGITAGNDQNLKVANAGWYTLHFKGKISKDKKNINWTLTVYKTQVCLIGACIGQTDWGFADENALTPPDDPSGDWVSPAFAAGCELRVAVKVGDINWYSTEFTIHKGEVFWRIKNMPNNWAETMGNEYSVTTTPGKKLYVNFDTNKAEVK